MESRDFAKLLVTELVEKELPKNVRYFHKLNGINSDKLADADEIWKAFARYNLDTKGVKSTLTQDRWIKTPNSSLLKNRLSLLKAINQIKNQATLCSKNFTECPVTYTQKQGFTKNCRYPKLFNQCPVAILTRELAWHRAHYSVAKTIVESANKLLLKDEVGRKEANLNHIMQDIFDRRRNSCKSWKTGATEEFLSKFEGIRGYGKPPKVIVWFLSDLCSPVHHINHWPEIDLSQLIPVDTHVRRLSMRFGFVRAGNVSNDQICDGLKRLYPEEPRKLDFALYRLGAEMEENICSKTPNCLLCSSRFPKIYEPCPAKTTKEAIIKLKPDATKWVQDKISVSIALTPSKVELSSKKSEWISDAQTSLVDTYVEIFNNKIDTNQENGYGKIKEQNEYFQTELLGIIRKYLLLNLSEKNLKVEIGNVEKSHSSHLAHIIVKSRDLRNQSAVLAVIKVNSWGDLSGYKRFRSVLRSCGLVEKGFYLAINGSMRDVFDGENQDLCPRVFFFSRILGANVSAKIKILSNSGLNFGVLEHFLEALEKKINQEQ